jgi:hypothetical protein
MEKFALTLQSKNEIIAAVKDRFMMRYESQIMTEILTAIEHVDQKQIDWFAGFGDNFRAILMNVNQYRRGLIYGFNEISLDKYGWLTNPKFMDCEEIKLEQSSIRLGRGANYKWSYALSLTYGCAGSSGPLGVFCPPFNSREAALTSALADVKKDFTSKIGNTDTSNYKPDLILKTLKAISEQEVGMVQLSLF